MVQCVLKGTHDSHGAYTHHQGGSDEALHKAAVLPAGGPGLEPLAQLPQPALQVQALPHQGAQHQREDHPQGAAGLQAGAGDGQQAGQTAGRADEQGAQAQTSQDRILVVLLQAAFKKQAQESA